MSHSDHGVPVIRDYSPTKMCPATSLGSSRPSSTPSTCTRTYAPASLNEALRAGHDTRVLELAEQLGIELHGLAEAADDAADGLVALGDGVEHADDALT